MRRTAICLAMLACALRPSHARAAAAPKNETPPAGRTGGGAAPDAAAVARAIDLAERYLRANCDPGGSFRYLRHPDGRKYPAGKYNLLRHAGSIYSLAAAWKRRPAPATEKALARACISGPASAPSPAPPPVSHSGARQREDSPAAGWPSWEAAAWRSSAW